MKKIAPPARLALACLLLAGCRTTTITQLQDRDTVYQLAPFLYVLSGNYDGTITAAQFTAAGNLGIGTFQGLDGEAVLLDGILYQVKGDGSVHLPRPETPMPFGACTLFDSDRRSTVRHIGSYEAFSRALESALENRQLFHAVRADGLFRTVRVRSCDRQQKPYLPLAEATRFQHEYLYRDVRGTLVGFWTPPFVPGSIGVPGFHLHFISEDRAQGGHLLDFSADRLEVALDPSPRLTVDFSTPVAVPLVSSDIEGQVRDAEHRRAPSRP